MQRQEQARLQPPGDAGALLEGQIFVLLAGQRDADPAALLEQVGQLLRHHQGQILLADRAGYAGAPGIAPAMAGIDQHDRPPGKPRLAHPDVRHRLGQDQGQAAGSRLADERDGIADHAAAAASSGQCQQARPMPAPRHRSPSPILPLRSMSQRVRPGRPASPRAASREFLTARWLRGGGADANRNCPSDLSEGHCAAADRIRGIQG